MKFLRNKRRAAAAAAGGCAVVIGLTLAVVLPALAATSTGFNGATTLVAPMYLASGGENDCALFTANNAKAVGSDQYFASNPKAISGKQQTLTATNGAHVNLTVTVDKTYTFLRFSMSGGVVTDVGIKGGNGTDWYSYEGQPLGGVTADEGLTAPAQSSNGNPPFYGLTQTVFCYTPKITCQANVPMSDPQDQGGETVEVPSCAGKSNVFFNFSSGSLDSTRNFVSVYTYGGSGTPTTPLVEHFTGTLPSDTQPTLQYSDTNPPSDPLHDMRLCQLDPRADPNGADPLALADAYKSLPPAGTQSPVLPPPNGADPEDSSCLITSHTWIDANGVPHFEAYVYSTIDGFRGY